MSKRVLVWLVLALMAAGAGAQTVTGSGNANTVPVFTATPATGNSTVTSSPITVSGGNVGIGTASPSQALEINNSSGANIIARTNQTASQIQAARLLTGAYTGNPITAIYSYGSSGSNLLYFGGGTSVGEPASTIRFNTGAAGATGAGTTAMTINSSGYVGIGTTNPLYPFSVGSSAQFWVSSAGAISAASATLATPLSVANGGSGSTSISGLVKGNGTGPFTAAVAGSDYQQPLTFSSGLTNTSNAITNNLSVGVAGGQTAIGGTGITDLLVLKGTTANGTATSPAIKMNVGNNGATTAVTVLNNGDVGIGTTSPPYSLDVKANSASAAVAARFYGQSGSSSNNAQVRWAGQKDGELWSLGPDVSAGGSTGDFEFYNLGNAGGSTGTKLTILGSGNVGIGTTSPSALLSVGPTSQFQVSSAGLISTSGGLTVSSGAVSLPSASIANSALIGGGGITVTAGAGLSGGGPVALGASTTLALPTVGTAGTYGSATQVPVLTTDSYGRITGVTNTSISSNSILGTSNTWTAAQAFNAGATFPSSGIWNASGQVGIGTPSPSYPLDVKATGASPVAARFYGQFGSSSDNAQVRWAGQKDGELWSLGPDISAGGSTGDFEFYNMGNAGGSAGTKLTILGSGNVGIGTTNPGTTYANTKLEVNGYIQTDAGIYFPGNSTPQTQPYTGVTCGGDYAESVDVAGDRKNYEPGDVLVIGAESGSDVLKSAEPYSTLVAGIYSTKPGTVGRRQLTDAKTSTSEVPMAMVGIVPTKVSAENGPIKRGDLLVTSSTLGYAMKGTDRNRMLGAVVGKALGALDSGTGMIEVLVSLQ